MRLSSSLLIPNKTEDEIPSYERQTLTIEREGGIGEAIRFRILNYNGGVERYCDVDRETFLRMISAI